MVYKSYLPYQQLFFQSFAIFYPYELSPFPKYLWTYFPFNSKRKIFMYFTIKMKRKTFSDCKKSEGKNTFVLLLYYIHVFILISFCIWEITPFSANKECLCFCVVHVLTCLIVHMTTFHTSHRVLLSANIPL